MEQYGGLHGAVWGAYMEQYVGQQSTDLDREGGEKGFTQWPSHGTQYT